MTVLEAIANGRAHLERQGRAKDMASYLSARRARELRYELAELGVHFGIPFGSAVPIAREQGEWRYLGTVLRDVHVFEQVEAP